MSTTSTTTTSIRSGSPTRAQLRNRSRSRGRDRSWLRPAFDPGDSAAPVPGAPVLDPAHRTARFGGSVAVFSDVEYAVFALLTAHPHVMLTRDEIARHAWGAPVTSPDRVTSAIKRVRVRLREAGVDPDQIATIHTLGYRWDPPAADERGQQSA